MELKDVILSTLAEMENESTEYEAPANALETPSPEPEITTAKQEERSAQQLKSFDGLAQKGSESELHYLKSIRERLLVLFEGFQAPNNTNIEAKIDMTLNFLEYMLATIDERVEKLEKGESA